MTEERCICCGAVIPEGLQVCPSCSHSDAGMATAVNRIANGAYKAGSRGRLKAYVCSPYRGDAKRNVKYAQEITKCAVRKGYAPIVPQLYLPQILDDEDPSERALGLDVGLALLQGCDLIIVGGQYGISAGMATEIREALRLCIPIKHI